jgi:outer membrane receptor protein involved in Fe transport
MNSLRLGSFLFAAGLASSQVGAADVQGTDTIEEVVVTALKRNTRLQDTPMSMLAVSGESLHDRGIDNVADLLRTTPGLSLVDQGAGQKRLVIRGVQSAGEAQTGLYYDETPVSAGTPSTTNDAGQRSPELRLFDVERIEVLRGPQGTLYGSGSMGGTVRVLFNKPGYEYAASIDSSFESTEDGDTGYQVNAMLNAPLVGEQLAARSVFYYRDRGGYVDNVTLARQDVNSELSRGGRVLVRYQPSDKVTLDAAVHIQREDSFVSAWELPAGTYRTAVPTQLPVHDDFELYSLTLNWDVGFATLTGVSSLFKRELAVTIDASRLMANFGPLGAPFRPSVLLQPQDVEDRSHELRLSSNGAGPLHWTAGVYFEEREAFTISEQLLADPLTGLPREPRSVATRRTIDDSLEQRAVFGELSYDVTTALTLTAGARYFDYEKSITGETTVGFPLLGAVVTPPTTVTSDEDGWVSKINVAYRLGSDALIYAQANEGFRPGGANQVVGLPAALTPYEADSLWNYEIGARTRWLRDTVTLNLAAFRIDWDNMQVTGRTRDGAFNFISNAGAARIDGVELETLFLPLPGLELSLGGAYMDAKLSADQSDPNVNAPGRDGDRIPNVPKYSASFAAKYEWALAGSLNALLRADVSYAGSSFSEFRPNNPFNERIDDYTLTNLRVGVRNESGGWSAYVFVNNVFDEVAIGRVLSSAFGRDLTFSSPPRTVGVNLSKSI